MNKEYSFETQDIDGKKEIVLCLKDFPEVKFRYKFIRLGSIDEEQQVPVIFDIDLIEENRVFPEDPEFVIQAARLLTDLLDKMSQRKHEIANSIN
jgi:hypothetical protein